MSAATLAAIANIEHLLQAKKLDGTLLRPLKGDLTGAPTEALTGALTGAWTAAVGRPVASTGVGALDDALGGGWPRGEVSELIGGRSSGRTSTMLSTLAAATARGEIVGVVDAVDRWDLAAATAAGVDHARVLWVRGPSCTAEQATPGMLDRALHQAIRAYDLLIRAGGFGVVVLDVSDIPAVFLRGLPAATWLRLARANEGRPTSCVMASGTPIGRSARGVTVTLDAQARWTGDRAQSRRFAGLEISATIGQASRLVSRPSRPLQWTLRAAS